MLECGKAWPAKPADWDDIRASATAAAAKCGAVRLAAHNTQETTKELRHWRACLTSAIANQVSTLLIRSVINES